MAKLPVEQASKLAESMAKSGLSGSIMMGKKAPPADQEEGDNQDGASEMEHCLDECADAMVSGDKQAIKSALRDLLDCVKAEDATQDQGMGHTASSY